MRTAHQPNIDHTTTPPKKGLNYSEYKCPCGGHTQRRHVSTKPKGFFKVRMIFTYYYECTFCGKVSEHYQADVTHKYK